MRGQPPADAQHRPLSGTASALYRADGGEALRGSSRDRARYAEKGLLVSWEATTALASVASALIVLVASAAAVLQLRHLRLANQLQAYLDIKKAYDSPEFQAARHFLRTCDMSDPDTVAAMTMPIVDPRLNAIGAHYQHVARLLNRGVLDEELFAAYHDTAPRVWKSLQPVADALRRGTGSPIWIDFEYLAYRSQRDRLVEKFLARYPADFVEHAQVAPYLDGGLGPRDKATSP